MRAHCSLTCGLTLGFCLPWHLLMIQGGRLLYNKGGYKKKSEHPRTEQSMRLLHAEMNINPVHHSYGTMNATMHVHTVS